MYSTFLIWVAILDEPNYQELLFSLFGGSEYQSSFDRLKFITPITLLMVLTTDYSTYCLKSGCFYTLPRYKDRKQWLKKIFVDLGCINFFAILIVVILTILLSIAREIHFEALWTSDSILILISTYFMYYLIILLQLFLSMKKNTTFSFFVILSLIIASTFTNDSILGFVFISPTKMIVACDSTLCTLCIIAIMIVLLYIIYKLTLIDLEKRNMG